MNEFIRIALSLTVAYLLGAIPFALLTSTLIFHIDLRQHGSGNLGATNVVRVLGWRAGLAVAVLDVAKGSAAVFIAKILLPDTLSVDAADWVLIGAAMCAVLGHSYSPYIRFRGGKGVATAAGVILMLTPAAWVIMLVVFLGVSAGTRMVSLGSILAAIVYPILCVTMYGDRLAIVIMSFTAAAVVLWRHRTNMVRIVKGKESRIGRGGSAIRGSVLSESETADVSSKES